ncbi:MAG: Uroporphyrinogen-III synthase HemD [Cenarchaeum symbiont of Oopsacas minuta]|nr:Uroporphyrinogen-III synthase HemD [Cenarchaeum symbiont of Oopsacas minuta]
MEMIMSLSGKTIVITRPADEASEFINLLKSKGAQIIPLRAIEVASNSETIASEFLSLMKSFDPEFSAFLSSKSVKTLFESAKIESIYDEMLSVVKNTTVVAVGPRTKEMLNSIGVRVAHVPQNYSSIGIGELFTTLSAVGKKIIMPRSSASRSFLKDLLEKIGLDVLEIKTYKVCTTTDMSGWDDFAKKFFDANIDCIAFTSASSVNAFFEILESKGFSRDKICREILNLKIFTIGSQADKEFKNMQIKTCIANVHTIKGLADMISKDLE